MTRLAARKAREEFRDLVDRVVQEHERIVVQRRGKDVAAIVPIDDLKLLKKLEDRLDYEAALEALNEPGAIPWKKVKADLGL